MLLAGVSGIWLSGTTLLAIVRVGDAAGLAMAEEDDDFIMGLVGGNRTCT